MAKCKISVLAYFPIKNFIDNTLENASSSNQFQTLVDLMSTTGFEFDYNTKEDREILTELFNGIKSDNPAFESFKKWVVNESYVVKKEEERENTGGQSRNPQHDVVEQEDIDRSITGIKKSQLNFEKTSPKRKDIAINFFGGDFYSFKRYEESIKKNVFKSVLINFDKGYSVKNNSELTSNLNYLYNQTMSSLENYLKNVGEITGTTSEDKILEVASDYFTKLLNDQSISSLENNNVEALKAYDNFVTLKVGFDSIASIYSLGIVKIKSNLVGKYNANDPEKYYLDNGANFAFSYGNDNFSLLDETTSLIKALVDITNIVKLDDNNIPYVDESEYLNMNSVLSTITKIKTAHSVKNKFTRFNPINGYSKIMQSILLNPAVYPEFSTDDLNNLRTMYNFYYKTTDNHSFNVNSIHSLATIYANDVKQLGVNDTDSNLLINITSHFDKAVSKLYTAMEYNDATKTWVSKEAKESNANKQYGQNIDIFNNYIISNNKSLSNRFKSHLNVLDGSGNILTNPTITLGGITFDIGSKNISLPASFSKNDFIDGVNGNISDSNKQKIYDAIVDADKILNLNIFTNSSRLGKYLFENSVDLNIKGLLKLTSNVLYLADGKYRAEKESETKGRSYKNALKKVITKNMYDAHIPNDRVIEAISENDGIVTSFLINLSAAQNIISGDAYKSTITADSGAKFPSVGLISVIHDDKTNFAEIEMSIRDALVAEAMGDGPETMLAMIKDFDNYDALVSEYVAETGDNNPTEYSVDNWYLDREQTKFENSIKNALDTIPVTKNIFGQYDTAEGELTNFDLLDGEILRTTISIDGDVKEAAKMSTGELATHAIFGDFYSNIANPESGNNTVALQLVVYADKIGQMLKKFNLNHVVQYDGKSIDLKNASMDQLRELHRSSIGSQYLSLQNRVSDELRTLFLQVFGDANPENDFQTDVINRFKKNYKWMQKGLTSDLQILPDYDSKIARNDLNNLKSALKSIKKIIKGENLLYSDYEQIIPLYSEEELVNYGVNAGIDVQHEVHYSGRKKLSLNNVLLIEFKNYEDSDKGIARQTKRMNTEQKKMARSLLKNGFSMSAFNESNILKREKGKPTATSLEYNPQLIAIEKYIKNIEPGFDLNDWIDDETGELVVFKIDGEIGTLEDLQVDYSKKIDPIRQDIDFQMNPIFEYYFWMHNILTTNYNLAVAGGIHGHELKGIDRMDVKNMSKDYNNGLFEEAIISTRTNASDKRNVFFQATRHEYEQDVVEGIPLHVRTAVINDIKGFLYNFIGETEDFANWDGSALMTAKAMIMGDNSLGQLSTRSFTHKLIHHRYDPRYLVAELEKYAVFGLTNEMIRKSLGSAINAKHVLQKMEDIRLGNTFNIFDPAYNEDSLIDMGDGYMMWDYLADKVLYKQPDAKVITRVVGFKQIVAADGSLSYLVRREFLKPDGTITVSDSTDPIRIDSVFSLWEALGGEYSVEEVTDGSFKFGPHGNFYYSEASNYNSAEVMNRYRKLINPNKTEYVQSNYDMPLKNAMIYQLNNTSGIKNGAKNINPSSRWTDKEVDKPFHSYITNTLHWGIQMNSDHGYDEEHVSTVTEMSQVMSAAEANGHYHTVAKQLYKNIAKVVELSMEKYNKALSGQRSELYLILTKDMMKSLLNADELGFAQSYLTRVKNSLDELGKKDDSINVNDLYNTVLTAFSDNNMYSAMISMIAGSVNRTSIKRKYSGIASVIRPGRELYTVKELANGSIVDNEQNFKPEYTQVLPNRITPYDTVKITSNGKSVEFNFENPKVGYKTPYDAYFAFNDSPETFLKTIGLEPSDKISYEIVNGNARNLRGTVLQINYNGAILDRLDLDSVRAKFALNELKNVYTDLLKAESRVNDIAEDFETHNNSTTREYSNYDLQQANEAYQNKLNAYEQFKKSNGYKILKQFIPAPDEDIIRDFKNIELTLFKEVEKDHLLLEKNRLRVPSHLNNGVVSLNDSVEIAPVKKKYAECLLSNINRFKYGIEKGTKLSEVNYDYFYNKLINKQLTRFKQSDFYTQSLKGDSELHFLNKDDYEKFRDANPDKVKASAKVQTESVINDNGETIVYLIDSSTGNRLFPINGFLETNDEGEILNDLSNIVVEINNQLVVVYDNLAEINSLISDVNFSYGVFKYNVNGNVDMQRLYHSQYDHDNSSIAKLLSLDTKKARQNFAVQQAIEENKLLAMQLNESWKKQLQVIAARIPAQSLQSFMAMEVVGFVDDDINAVILPTMKNWLDGSDFDIDKTYMLGFGVDKKGMLFKFNQFFNETESETSYLKLPIPEGKSAKIQYVDTSTITPEQIENAIKYLSSNKIDQRTKFLDGGVSHLFDDFASILGHDYYSDLDTVYIKLPKEAQSIQGIEKLEKAFKKYHERKVNPNTILETTKNSVAQSLITISSAIGNILSGERPISMKDTRKASSKTTKAQDARELSRENPMSIYQQIIQQNAGKAVVGISAVGEKVFFAYSYFINESLMKIEDSIKSLDDSDPIKLEEAKAQLKRLSGNTTIKRKDGKVIIPNLIANANLTNTPFMQKAYYEFLNDLNNDAIQKYGEGNFVVINVETIDDASLVISEVLSAATDNAKELILDKINAGPELAGVYMYMIMQGVPFGDIADIMISDTVNKVVAKSKQNWFNKSQKNNNIDNAISYYLEGVNPYDFFEDYTLINEFATRLEKATNIKWNKKDTKTEKKESAKDYIFKAMNSMDVKKLNKLKKDISTDSFNTSQIDRETGEVTSYGETYFMKFMINKFINENIKRINEIGSDPVKFMDDLRNFTKLRDASEELTIFGRRLGINQGIKTNMYDAYNYDYSMNNWLHKQFKRLPDGAVASALSKLPGRTAAILTDIKAIHSLSEVEQKVISNLYNEVKYSMNILEAELNLPHFQSMIKAGYSTQNVFETVSSRYDIHNQIVKGLTEKGYLKRNKEGYYYKFDDKEFKTISSYIVNKLIDRFFAENKQFRFKIPKGSKLIAMDNGKYSKLTSDNNYELDLSTPENKATFKLFFESEFIPRLQETYPDNKFIQSLIVDKKRNSINGTEYFYTKSNFNMSSVTDKKNVNSTAEIIFNGLQEGFENLNSAVEMGNNVQEMFAIYNILINKNAFGASTFTKLFQSTSYMSDENAPFNKFMEYQGKRDLFKDLLITEQMYDEVALRLAEVVTHAKETDQNSMYLKKFNKNKGRYDIVKYDGTKPITVVMQNVDGDVDSYMIDDFISDAIIDKLSASKQDVKTITAQLNLGILDGSIIQFIKCD